MLTSPVTLANQRRWRRQASLCEDFLTVRAHATWPAFRWVFRVMHHTTLPAVLYVCTGRVITVEAWDIGGLHSSNTQWCKMCLHPTLKKNGHYKSIQSRADDDHLNLSGVFQYENTPPTGHKETWNHLSHWESIPRLPMDCECTNTPEP